MMMKLVFAIAFHEPFSWAAGLILVVLCNFSSTSASDQEALEKRGAKLKVKDNEIIEMSADVDDWTKADYQLVARQTGMKSLTLSGKTITDDHLKTLTDLKNLEALSTNGSQLTDDGYKHFQAFSKLQRLALWHPSREVAEFTGSGLRHLKPLKELKQLTFAGGKTGDAAMQALADLTQLEDYSQWHNLETADGMKQLARLENLKSLRLGQRLYDYKLKSPASFDTSTFDILAEMDSLESIEIMEARLNYEAISKLSKLPKLKRLRIHKIAIDAADIERLQQTLPNVEIIWEPLTPEQEAADLVKKLKI
jgi:hypothetical protein